MSPDPAGDCAREPRGHRAPTNSAFEPRAAERVARDHFGSSTLDGFRLRDREAAIRAAGAALPTSRTRRRRTCPTSAAWRPASQPPMPCASTPITCRHLDSSTGSDGQFEGSLLPSSTARRSAMGGRLLRAWLLRPLVELERHHANGSTPSKRWRARRRRRARAGGLASRARPRAPASRAWCSARRRPATSSALRDARCARHSRRAGACSPMPRRPLLRAPVAPSSTTWRTCGRSSSRAHRRRAAGAWPGRRLRSRAASMPSSTSCARSAAAAAGHRRDWRRRARRAPASRR